MGDDRSTPTMAERSATWDRDDTARALLICGAWLAVAFVEFAGVWIAQLGGESVLVRWLAYAAAVSVTAGMVGAQLRLRRRRWAALALMLSAATAAGIVVVDWTPAAVRGYYLFHRGDFSAVVAASADGGLTADTYYGELLPPDLEHLSIKGTVARAAGGELAAEVLFLPVWTAYPDGAGGYAYLGDAAPAATYEWYGYQFRTRWALGDGWHWLQRGPFVQATMR